MKANLLDGSDAHDGTGERVRALLAVQLQAGGWDVEHMIQREKMGVVHSSGRVLPGVMRHAGYSTRS